MLAPGRAPLLAGRWLLLLLLLPVVVEPAAARETEFQQQQQRHRASLGEGESESESESSSRSEQQDKSPGKQIVAAADNRSTKEAAGAAEQEPPYMQHMTSVLVCLHLSVFVTGLVGNSLVCLSVIRNKSLQTVTNYYIVNLAVADFLVILICLPPTVYWDLTLTWNFGLVLCKLVLYLQSISVSVSVLTLTCISIDRWYAICRPLEFSSTKYRAKVTICLIWLVSLLIASPDAIFLQTKPLYEEDDYVYTDCTYSWPESNTKIYQLCIVTLLFVGPFVLMSISYSHIVNVLWRDEMSAAIQSADTSRAVLSPAVADYGNAASAPVTAPDSAASNQHQAAAAAAATKPARQEEGGKNKWPGSEVGATNNNKQRPATAGESSGSVVVVVVVDSERTICAHRRTDADSRASSGQAERQPTGGGAGNELATEGGARPADRAIGSSEDETPKVIPNQSVASKSSSGQLSGQTKPSGAAATTSTASSPAKGETASVAAEAAEENLSPESTSAVATKTEGQDRIERGSGQELAAAAAAAGRGGRRRGRCCCCQLLAGAGRPQRLTTGLAGTRRESPLGAGQPAPADARSRASSIRQQVGGATTSKKYRRNLANYAAKRDQYRPPTTGNSSSNSKPAKCSLTMHLVGCANSNPTSTSSSNSNNNNNNSHGRFSGKQSCTDQQNNLHLPDQQNQQQQQPNYLSSSSSNNARFYKLIESRKKAAKMLIVIVIMFGLCYLPVHFLNTLRYTVGLPQNDITTIASLVSHWLCYFNSAINPLIYNLMSGKFRKEFADLFFCRCFRRQNS